MIGTMASIMSSTIINVAVPDMSRFFGLGQDRLQWVSSGFMVAMTVSMLTTPWLLARYGYRKTYSGAVGLLLAGGVAGGLTSNFELVLLARAVEGLASGVLQPIPAIIIVRAFGSGEQGRAGGIFGMGVVLAPAIGPSIGGVLVDWFGWRATFFMVVPFCVAALVMAARFVPALIAARENQHGDKATLDWRGLLLVVFSTLALLNGLGNLHSGATGQAAALLASSLLTLWVFVRLQRRLSHTHRGNHPRMPLMNMALFNHRQFSMGSVVSFIYGAALFGSTYLLPVYLQMGLGLSASYVGTMLLPAGLALAVTIPVVGRMADKYPTHWLVSTGLVLLAAGFALMVTVNLQTAIWVIVLWVVVGRVGLGFILPSLNRGSLLGLGKHLLPQGSSSINYVRTVGGAVGVQMCAIALDWRLAAHGETLAHPSTNPGRLLAFNEAFLMLALTCALAIGAAWNLRGAKKAAQGAP
ncbi:MAG: DHA2 family efflux MFS transporter permease subunit [Burkholderiales bacterium]|nr:DHA2 family efflux MFS transporter permease subunit [Burkholderiales bacterium]